MMQDKKTVSGHSHIYMKMKAITHKLKSTYDIKIPIHLNIGKVPK